jgi:hypothetical protein
MGHKFFWALAHGKTKLRIRPHTADPKTPTLDVGLRSASKHRGSLPPS